MGALTIQWILQVCGSFCWDDGCVLGDRISEFAWDFDLWTFEEQEAQDEKRS